MLTKIIQHKEKEIDVLPPARSGQLDLTTRNHRPFALSLLRSEKKPALIAEVKKASPSKGIIKEDFDPIQIAKEYEKAGAACLSVLTDTEFFQGSLEYLKEIRKHVSIPLLRKDFIIDERQIVESVEHGADAILLIAACLTKERFKSLYEFAEECGLECLIEVHTKEEIEQVYEICNPSMIGINNRDLKNFTTSINHTFSLLPYISKESLVISESGIKTDVEVKSLSDNGVNGMLIGETLMRADSIEKKITEIYRNVR
ncbi:indole-3-glycerol phosphate synthase TrpC [Fictibacillus phosphorivorans]|uniref:indole-3-glycerol phosphate synthase TrpC n=1 Tax=Fictibacillus phosphorivorans TaxID=1221500 RepID=UPI002041FB0F|nr:indole-3-glycerol phosphate synthase TrpC [Fictibacillus phosphorivorans]MCM3718929.1 indole-3-glycerol phosphate synthase TrpC [Fictibacillus phosphorivorans]MCM3776551.1 indole-3-glycerol phosphate synthase TrpC [Fictibacillus phosphorivorans]